MHLKAYATSGTIAVVADTVRALHNGGSRALSTAMDRKFGYRAAKCLEIADDRLTHYGDRVRDTR